MCCGISGRKDNAPFEGQFVKFAGVTLEPKPVQNPCPIWLATNAERLSHGPGRFRRLGLRAAGASAASPTAG